MLAVALAAGELIWGVLGVPRSIPNLWGHNLSGQRGLGTAGGTQLRPQAAELGCAGHRGQRNEGESLVSPSCMGTSEAINHKCDCTHFRVEKGLFLLRGVFKVALELLISVFRVGDCQ